MVHNILSMTRGDMTSFEDIVRQCPHVTIQATRLAEMIIARATYERETSRDEVLQQQVDQQLAELNSCTKLIETLHSPNSNMYQRLIAHCALSEYPSRFEQLLLKLDYDRVKGLSPLAMSVLTSNGWTDIEDVFFEGTMG